MKKVLNITIITIGVIIYLILIDTFQAYFLNNSPLIKVRDYYNGGTINYIDKGLFVDHYYCVNSEEKTLFKNAKYDCQVNVQNIDDIDSIDDFYSLNLTKDFDVRTLSASYNTSDAIDDNYLVNNNVKVFNANLFNEFIDNYHKRIDSFIRIGKTTIEGDLIIYDLLYLANNDKLYLVIDASRDKFGNESISLKEYKGIKEDENNWVLYNDEDDADNYFSIISIIREEKDTFIRTYKVLNIAESNDNKYLYLTLRAFQAEEVETVKVLKELAIDIKENNNYEFTFLYDNKKINDNIKELFLNRELLKIEETLKEGLDQIMDDVNI